MDMRVAAYAIVEKRGKILLTHWRRGRMHGWTLPGGGLESGEDPRDAVVREVYEETGLSAKPGKLLGIDSRVLVREEIAEGNDPELHTIRIVYRASVADGPLRHEVGGSSDEARWVPIKELRTLRTLSLVQTGLRMAGINVRSGGRSGGRPGARSSSKQPAGKQSGGKHTGGKQAGAKQAGVKQSGAKQPGKQRQTRQRQGQ